MRRARRMRNTLVAGALSMGLGVSAAVAANWDPALGAETKPAPAAPTTLNCFAQIESVDPAQRLVVHQYQSEPPYRQVNSRVITDTALGFTPKALIEKPYASGPLLSNTSYEYYAVAPDGGLWVVGVNTDRTLKKVKVNSTWAGIRSLTVAEHAYGYAQPASYTSSPYVYALTEAGGLNRYRIGRGVANMYDTKVLFTRGWGTIKTLTHANSWKLSNGDIADTLIATVTDGRLIQYVIPRSNPAAWTSTVISSSTWQNFTAIATHPCYTQWGTWNTHPTMMWMGVQPTGEVYGYVDQNVKVPTASDLKGFGRLDGGWEKASFGG